MARATQPAPRCCWISSVRRSCLPPPEVDGERLVDGRDLVLGELDVDHGADDLDDFTGIHFIVKGIGFRRRELGGGDLEDFLGDGRLAGLVVLEREVAQELGRVVLGGLHGDHARAVLRGLGREDELVDLVVDVEGQQGVSTSCDAGLERGFRGRRRGGRAPCPCRPELVQEFLQAVEREDGRTTGSWTSVFLKRG
jgi:hypothetical protein